MPPDAAAQSKTLLTIYLIEPFANILQENPYWVVGGFLLALLGFVFSMPSILQAIWGRPEVLIELVPRPGDIGQHLGGRFYTPPIKNTLLKFFGVAKPNIPLLFTSELTALGSHEYIYTYQAHRTGTRNGDGFHSTIGPEPVAFNVGEIREGKRVVWIGFGPNGGVDTWGQLTDGKYKLIGKVQYCVDFVMTFEVVLSIHPNGFHWVPDTLKITRRR